VAAASRVAGDRVCPARCATLTVVQLRALGLYSHDGELRPLRFRVGTLNVISGLSRTGKTELLKIIDFCAGRRTPNLAPGPITRKVAHFAGVFEGADGRRVVVVRPQPTGQSATTAMVAYGTDIDLPADGSKIEINATTETVRGALDDLLGLGGYDIEEFTGVRERLRASVSHAIQFCLQAQTELMSPTHLFHRGGEDVVAEDFAKLFPYFIGAVDERLVAARRRAAQLRRQLHTWLPRRASAAATPSVIVVLPTPPFWFANTYVSIWPPCRSCTYAGLHA
jgi:hypothetical protein